MQRKGRTVPLAGDGCGRIRAVWARHVRRRRRAAPDVLCETALVSRGQDEIGLVGRLAVILLGMMLLAGLWSDNVIGVVVGVIGLALVASAIGLVELAMALWYRSPRHRRLTD